MGIRVSEASLGASCPPSLRELLRAVDWSYDRASEVSGLSKSYVANLARGQKGQRHAGPEALQKIEQGLRSVGGGVSTHAEAAPEFVPWDNKLRTVIVPKTRTTPKRMIKNVPSMVADLLEQHGVNFSAGARAMGVTGGTLRQLAHGEVEFNDKRQRLVFAALHGTLPTGLNGAGEEPDRYSLGLAVVQLQAKNFDRVNDVAELLNGRLVFKLNTTAGWLLIYRMKGQDDLMKFKRIASRDSGKIVCP